MVAGVIFLPAQASSARGEILEVSLRSPQLLKITLEVGEGGWHAADGDSRNLLKLNFHGISRAPTGELVQILQP